MISLNFSHFMLSVKTHSLLLLFDQMSSYLHEARSLGSVALRKAENMEGGLHFNVFTVDFNEELVALYGGSLLRQTHFLHESIKAILRLYKVRPQISSTHQTGILTLDHRYCWWSNISLWGIHITHTPHLITFYIYIFKHLVNPSDLQVMQ